MELFDYSHCPNKDVCLIYHCLCVGTSVKRQLQCIQFEKGETVCQQGSPATGCYVLCRGRIKLSCLLPSGRRFLISVLGSGELFGEESFFSQSYVNCAKALDRSLVIFIAREELIRLMEAHPHLSVELATTLSHRCTTLYDRIVEASRCSVKERLASLLLQVQESNGAATPITRLSQSDIADLLGITRATVNANLRELASAGLISLAHCRVSLRDRDGLRKILQSPPLAHKTKTNASA